MAKEKILTEEEVLAIAEANPEIQDEEIKEEK